MAEGVVMAGQALAVADPRDLTAQDFATIARIAYSHAGIVLHDSKRVLVSSRLTKLVREYACRDLAELVGRVVDDAVVRARAIEALTTNHTKFFRESHHFDHVAATLRPLLLQAARERRRIRLWSAGSSSGEEVYSLAMTLLGQDRTEARLFLDGDVALLASDLNAAVIAAGREGRYPIDAQAAIPPALARIWTDIDSDTLRIRPEVRKLVRFRQLNLLNEWPISGEFDAIFCRNTMIYFDAKTTERLQVRLTERLRADGFLYIGHSERLLQDAATRLRPVGQTIFRKVRP